ncbi:MAG: hypothetical protein U1F57_11890 [bacterium]
MTSSVVVAGEDDPFLLDGCTSSTTKSAKRKSPLADGHLFSHVLGKALPLWPSRQLGLSANGTLVKMGPFR